MMPAASASPTVAHDEGFFSAKDNLRIFWERDVPEDPKAHVVIIHGYMDHLGRYRRVKEALLKDGFAVHAMDLRGHGQSDGKRSFNDHFEDHLDDIATFWLKVQKIAETKKVFILAHSFGSLLVTYLLAQGRLDQIAGAVLSSPFYAWAFKPPFLKVMVSKVVGKFVPWLPVKAELEPASLTRDVELQKEVERDPLYNRVATPRWFTECVRAQAQLLPQASKVKVPLFYLVGSADSIALPAGVRQFFEAAGSADKKLKEYPGAVHEVMNDLGKEEVWRDISSWISSHL